MEGTVRRRQLRFLPVTTETEMVSADVAMYQAAHVLDLATAEALRQKDLNALLAVAELWIGLAKSLEIEVDEEEEEKEKISFGFPSSSKIVTERSETEDGQESH